MDQKNDKNNIVDKDPRYASVNERMKRGNIKKFADIFTYIPKTVVARDIGMNYDTLRRRVKVPRSFNLIYFFRLAKLIGCDKYELLDIFYRETDNL